MVSSSLALLYGADHREELPIAGRSSLTQWNPASFSFFLIMETVTQTSILCKSNSAWCWHKSILVSHIEDFSLHLLVRKKPHPTTAIHNQETIYFAITSIHFFLCDYWRHSDMSFPPYKQILNKEFNFMLKEKCFLQCFFWNLHWILYPVFMRIKSAAMDTVRSVF